MPTFRHSALVPRSQGGFALIEALVSLLVVAFGLLAIASFQYTLSRSSDVAKQRTEATRIAQKEMDRLRSFGQRQSDGNITDTRYTYVEDVVSTSAAAAVLGVTTNTTYMLERQVRDASNTLITAATSPTLTNSADRSRSVNVIVSWTDRAGQAQDVRLASTISDGDPADLGPLGVRRRLGSTLRPKNRNINVPYPAVNVAACPTGTTGSCSAFVAPPGNVAYVFSNDTGNVVQSCTLTSYPISALTRSGATATATATGHPFTTGSWVNISGVTPAVYNGNFRLSGVTADILGPPVIPATFSYQPASTPAVTSVTGASARWALTEGINLTTLAGVTCTTYTNPRYLVSGYVRFSTGSNPSADDLINPSGNTFDLLSTGPLSIASIGSSAPLGYTCTAQRQKVVETNNVRGETIQTYSRAGNVVTIRTVRNHSYTVGMVIAVTGTANYALQGRFEIASTPSNDTFTYFEVGSNATDSTGRVELIQQLTLAETDAVPSAYNSTISTFGAYTCVVEPSTTGSPREWWGRLDLVPETSSAGGRVNWDTTTYRVCRYSADYNSQGLSNSDHPRNYRQVTGALDSQNFAVIPAGSSCPTDTAPTYTGNQAGDFYNTNTAAHQPTPAYSPTEPNDTTTAIPMQ
jgi:type IV pilus modification protein PilV